MHKNSTFRFLAFRSIILLGTERDQMSVTYQTKKVMGVCKCVVVDDRAWEGGNLVEKTYDWFAQDNKGNVWYFGEDTRSTRTARW